MFDFSRYYLTSVLLTKIKLSFHLQQQKNACWIHLHFPCDLPPTKGSYLVLRNATTAHRALPGPCSIWLPFSVIPILPLNCEGSVPCISLLHQWEFIVCVHVSLNIPKFHKYSLHWIGRANHAKDRSELGKRSFDYPYSLVSVLSNTHQVSAKTPKPPVNKTLWR